MTMMDTIKDVLGADPLKHADADMRAVIETFDGLNPKPIEDCTPEEARRQPTVADAVKRMMKQKGMTPDLGTVRTQDLTIPCLNGPLPARVYAPTNLAMGEKLPVVLYFHGGGFVIADLDTYDATPRALAQKANAIVVSAHYSQAPERKFPAAHTDANTVWSWLLDHAASLGGDPARMAIVGESAGGNLAANVGLYARDHGQPQPLFLGLVYPLADTGTMTLSYEENRNARPLNKAMMLWFVKQCLPDASDKDDQRLRLVKQNLEGLPPTRVVTAGIDPLHSEGESLVERLQDAGVTTTHRHYPGATHEFFGMASVVQAAREAQDFIVEGLNTAFLTRGTPYPSGSSLLTESEPLPSGVAGSTVGHSEVGPGPML